MISRWSRRQNFQILRLSLPWSGPQQLWRLAAVARRGSRRAAASAGPSKASSRRRSDSPAPLPAFAELAASLEEAVAAHEQQLALDEQRKKEWRLSHGGSSGTRGAAADVGADPGAAGPGGRPRAAPWRSSRRTSCRKTC